MPGRRAERVAPGLGHDNIEEGGVFVCRDTNAPPRKWVRQRFKQSYSRTVIAAFARDDNGEVALHYDYQNTPNVESERSVQTHFDTAQLRCMPERHLLDGSYYNSDRNDQGQAGTL